MEYFIKEGWMLNPDGKVVRGITAAIERNNGECPCHNPYSGTPDALCPCRAYREDGICHCSLYVPQVRDEVLEFISHFRNGGTEDTFLNGCCYWFAYILAARFIFMEITYNPVLGHFAARLGLDIYDITGKLEDDGNWIDWDDYQETEPIDAERVRVQCIDKKPLEEGYGSEV